MIPWRRSLAFLHRWLGLAFLCCLLPACLAGSVIVWKAELDAWLNPDLFYAAPSQARLLDEDELEAALRAQVPKIRVAWIELPEKAGGTAYASIGNWFDPADPGRRYSEAFLDPYTGRILGARSNFKPHLDRREGLMWLRRIHYSLGFVPGGLLLMGWVAVAWLVDSLFGTVLSFHGGTWRRWLRAFKLRKRFWDHDLHRAGSLWTWPFIIVLATSSIFLNLRREVFLPVLGIFMKPLPASWHEGFETAVLEWQFPLHTGTAFGVAGRVATSLAGLVVSLGLLAALRAWWRRSANSA
ncbi:MAG: hypothetical protein RLZZ393_2122 [Pseudomonadota bacterium]|jgi:uncharacterized iron-regulated membrane protein